MAIKNYASEKSLDAIFAELQKALGSHGAKQISYDYGDDGKVHGVQFVIKVNGRFIPIKLPARVEKAQAVLKRQWDESTISHKRGREKPMAMNRHIESLGAISWIGYRRKWHSWKSAWRKWKRCFYPICRIGRA